MADEKRQLILDLLARNKMGSETAKAAADVDKIGTAADAASKKTRGLGTASDKTSGQVEDLGDSSSEAERKLRKLDNEIDKVNQDLVLLAAQFADADDAAARLDVSKGIRKSQAELRRLSTSKGILEKILPDPGPASRSFMTKLVGGMASAGTGIATKAGSAVGPTIGLAIGAAAAPVLVSSMSAALSAGAGGMALGAGIALAVSKDKEIQQAGKHLGKRFAEGMSTAATDAYKKPIMESVGVLTRFGDRVTNRWREVFASTSGMIVPFVQDLVRAGDRISDSLAGAAERSGPALDALGDAIVMVADSAGHLIDTLANGSDTSADNLRMLVGVLTDVVDMSTNFLGVLNELSGNAWITGPLLPMLRDHYKDAAGESDTMTNATRHLAEGFADAARAATGQRDALVALSNEMKAATDPAFALLEAQDKVAESQKNLSKATRDHGKGSEEARQATRDLARAAIDLQAKAGGVAGTFDGKLTPAMRNTLKAADLTDKEIRGVEREMRSAKKAGDAYAKRYSAHVAVTGAKAARASLYSVKDIIDGIPRAVTIGMKITGVGNVSAAAAAIRKNTRASGGPVARGIPYLVGEHGPEMIVPEAAGRVLSAAATRGTIGNRQAPTNAPMGSGGMAGPARLELHGEAHIVAFMRSLIRRHNLLQVSA